jgi:hypothetical protein
MLYFLVAMQMKYQNQISFRRDGELNPVGFSRFSWQIPKCSMPIMW